MGTIRICTRPSHLALVQTEMVSNSIKSAGFDPEIIKVTSSGDYDQLSPLYGMQRTGIFVEEVNRKILTGEADIAVHSAKDLPSELPENLTILGVLPREAPNDVLISEYNLGDLPKGSTIGTSSIRRIHELKMVRPDLKIENLRGNFDTRIRKWKEGLYAGIILAKAGLNRMSLDVKFTDLGLDDFLPAPSQGIIAIVGRENSPFSVLINRISHQQTFEELVIERRLIAKLRLGCSLPAAILCRKQGDIYHIRTRFYSRNSRESKEFSRTLSNEDEVDGLAKEISEKVPSSYGFDFDYR